MRSSFANRLTFWLASGVLAAGLIGSWQPQSAAQPQRTFNPKGGRNPFVQPGSLLNELRNEDYLTELKFTEAQRADLRTIQAEFRNVFRITKDDERKQKIQAMEEQALSLLNVDQKAQWETKKAELLAASESGEKPKDATEKPAVPSVTTPPAAVPPPTVPPATGTPPVKKPLARLDGPPPPGTKPMLSFQSKDAAADSDEAMLSFNFQFAPWTDVLELFAKTADMTLDLQDTPSGTFSYRDSRSYAPMEALDVLNGYLLPRGFLLVRRDRFLVCLSIANGIPPNLAPEITAEELPQRGKNELVSLVIPLKGMQADVVVAEVRELLGPQGKASALKNTNSVVVTDIGGHVRRIYALLTSDTIDNRDTAFKSIPLKHISASEAERMVRRLFGLNSMGNSTATAQPQMVNGQPVPGQPANFQGGWGGRRRDRDRDGEPDQPQQPNQPNQPAAPVAVPQAPGTGSQFATKIQVTADNRTNHLLITTSAALMQVVEDAVKAMDTNIDANGNEVRRNDEPLLLKPYAISGGDISSTAQTINLMIPGVVVGQDARLGKVYIQATAAEHKEVAALIQELSSEGSSSVAVVYLQKMEAVALANTLTNLYTREGARAPTVEADAVGRRIIIRGTPDQIMQVKTILSQLGEGDGAPREKDRGNVRSLTLSGRDPEEILPLLKDAWSATRTNPIRIRVPSKPKPIRDRSVPGAGLPKAEPRDPVGETTERPSLIRAATFQRKKPKTKAVDEQPVPAEVQPADDAEADESMEEEVAPEDGESPVGLEIVGDQLIITGKDGKSLDQFEELFERIAAAIPPRTKWNVFYLRSADATEAAQMVERLFPQSNVTTTTSSGSSGLLGSVAGGFSTIGRGLMNMSGLNQTLSGAQHLRIVTDVRSNALFVTGPHDQVAEVEQILEVLDSSELPQSLRDRVPRTIAVEHADVDEVAGVVETVFKDAMTPENQMPGGGRGGFNPLMLMMGGGGGGNTQGGRRQPSVQLTLGVDKRASHLIVSCNDSLFQQIEELVQGIDERARLNRPTVRVVKLDQADPTLVQQTLGSLMPKVTVGSTRRSRRPANANGPGNPSSVSTSGAPPATPNAPAGGDAARDAAIQRMMIERLNQGGFGPGGGGRPGR